MPAAVNPTVAVRDGRQTKSVPVKAGELVTDAEGRLVRQRAQREARNGQELRAEVIYVPPLARNAHDAQKQQLELARQKTPYPGTINVRVWAIDEDDDRLEFVSESFKIGDGRKVEHSTLRAYFNLTQRFGRAAITIVDLEKFPAMHRQVVDRSAPGRVTSDPDLDETGAS